MRNLIIISLILTSLSLFSQAQVKTELTSTEVNSMIKNNEKWIILDVRTPVEFQQGHLKDAINIDFYQPDFKEQINKLDKNKVYLVYCRTKNRSTVAVNFMVESGFTRIYQMMDGYSGWGINNLPFEK
jgi:phage shock protein E